jgi:hypothetical protein
VDFYIDEYELAIKETLLGHQNARVDVCPLVKWYKMPKYGPPQHLSNTYHECLSFRHCPEDMVLDEWSWDKEKQCFNHLQQPGIDFYHPFPSPRVVQNGKEEDWQSRIYTRALSGSVHIGKKNSQGWRSLYHPSQEYSEVGECLMDAGDEDCSTSSLYTFIAISKMTKLTRKEEAVA